MGQALGGFGATIADKYSWSAAFHYFGIAGIVYSLLLIFLLRERKPEPVTADSLQPMQKQNITKGLGLLFANISFWILLFYFAIPSLPGWGVKNWLPTLFAENLQIDMAQAGPLSTITIAAPSFLGVIFCGVLSDRLVQRNIRGRIYTSAIGVGFTVPFFLLGCFWSSF